MLTDDTGHYSFSTVPSGSGTVTISIGSFVGSTDVIISDGQLLDLAGGQACLEATTTKIATITGLYDSIEHIISSLGFEQDLFCGGTSSYGARHLLSNAALLNSYDVVFVNCGLSIDYQAGEGMQMAQNLKNFIEAGGSAYVSDTSAGLVATAYPGLISFDLLYDPMAIESFEPCCTCGQNCPSYCGAQPQGTGYDVSSSCQGIMPIYGEQCAFSDPFYGTGDVGVLQATVVHPNLRAALGRDTFDVHFDLPSWVPLTNHDRQRVEVLIANGQRPLMVRYTSNAGGNLIYTSFHNEQQASQDLQTILRALIFEL